MEKVGIKMGECKVNGKLRQCYVSTPMILLMPYERCCLPDVARKHPEVRLDATHWPWRVFQQDSLKYYICFVMNMPFISSREGRKRIFNSWLRHSCKMHFSLHSVKYVKINSKNLNILYYPFACQRQLFLSAYDLCKHFGPYQDRQNVGSDMDPIRIFEKVNFEKKQQTSKSWAKHQACKKLKQGH